MRVWKEERREVIEKFCLLVRCDLCGNPIPLDAEAQAPGDIVHEVLISHSKVRRREDGKADVTKFEVDACGPCFERHVRPTLIKYLQRGASPQSTEEV